MIFKNSLVISWNLALHVLTLHPSKLQNYIMQNYEKEIESMFYQITLPLNEKKSVYGISLDGFKLAAENLIAKATLEAKLEVLNEVRTDLNKLITSV
jgi:hypothetical protein